MIDTRRASQPWKRDRRWGRVRYCSQYLNAKNQSTKNATIGLTEFAEDEDEALMEEFVVVLVLLEQVAVETVGG